MYVFMSLPITLIFVCPKPKQTDAYSLGQHRLHSTTATIQQHALLQFYCRRSPRQITSLYARGYQFRTQINHIILFVRSCCCRHPTKSHDILSGIMVCLSAHLGRGLFARARVTSVTQSTNSTIFKMLQNCKKTMKNSVHKTIGCCRRFKKNHGLVQFCSVIKWPK